MSERQMSVLCHFYCLEINFLNEYQKEYNYVAMVTSYAINIMFCYHKTVSWILYRPKYENNLHRKIWALTLSIFQNVSRKIHAVSCKMQYFLFCQRTSTPTSMYEMGSIWKLITIPVVYLSDPWCVSIAMCHKYDGITTISAFIRGKQTTGNNTLYTYTYE